MPNPGEQIDYQYHRAVNDCRGHFNNMNIKPISILLHDNDLEYPNLAVLQSSDSLYTALLVQPKAHIQVRDEFIRNADREDACAMFMAIAQEAHAQSVELLVTPEYSVPWETIEHLLRGGIAPDVGQLWVLGSESLSLAELPALKDRFSQWAIVLHETLPPGQPATARYLDPLIYLFRTKTSSSKEPRIVMVVQFKTCPSGDPHNTEATRMAMGSDVYLFEHGNEVRLITIICSDAFAFTDKVDANYENLLLLHLQLNESPRNEAYMRYRRRLYDFPCDQTELICLNWAENFVFDLADGSPVTTKANISASAWHSKSRKFATEDAHVEQNHGYGLYYTRDADQHRHMLHFAYKPAAFLLQATKARHHAVEAAKSRQRGPELTRVYRWNIATLAWVDADHPVDDGFVAMTGAYGAPASVLNVSHTASPLAVERLSCITSGDFGPMSNWFAASQLPTTLLEPRTEVMRRVTVTQDPDGKPFRDLRVRTIKALASIPPETLPLPSRLKDVQDGYRFEWTVDAPHCNVISNGTGQRATLVYAGESPLNDDLAGFHAKASATTYRSHQADRVCVLYREGQDVKLFAPPKARSIAQSSTRPGKDFTEPDK